MKIKIILGIVIAMVAGALVHKAVQEHSHGSEPSEKHGQYICPMHPQIIRNEPSTCPICAMDLVPMKNHQAADPQSSQEMPHDAVLVESAVIQNIGVKISAVQESDVKGQVKLVGEVAMNPERQALVNSRVSGWIEKVLVGAQGVRVFQGQNLALLYSPDLVAAQEDYLQALGMQDQALVRSTKNRLEILGMSTRTLAILDSQRTVLRLVPIEAPMSGVVLSTSLVQGQAVMPGLDLYRIADLSKLWVTAQAYPEDLKRMQVGMSAQIEFPQSAEQTTLQSKITYISPTVDPNTKVAEVRVSFANNSTRSYKPGMSADLRIPFALGKGIVVPKQAVIRTGERTVAVVSLGHGYFAPRELVLGSDLGDSLQVLQGLSVGDSLVTSAQFLIDSESNLKKAVSMFSGGSNAHSNH